MEEQKGFCTGCKKEAAYHLQETEFKKTIRDKDYTFNITVAICTKCGEEMSVLELIDKNIREIERQYKATLSPLISIN